MYRPLGNKLKLTSERKRILQNVVIDEDHPGTILHDFNVMLDNFRQRTQKLTAAQQVPLSLLAEINQRLAHPLPLTLKRAQQKSYPNIQGLYLLLRASGLSYVDTSGKQPVLIIDDACYQQWQGLNETERYGSLLETWLLRGFPDIIGESSRPIWSIPNTMNEIVQFLAMDDLEAGLQVAGNHQVEAQIMYFPGRYNLALLDLFGFVSIQSSPPQPNEGWRIERIRLTPIGGAFLALLCNDFFGDLTAAYELVDETGSSFGLLQTILQPYLPAWINNLTVTKAPFQKGAHVFKVSLGEMWRRIAIEASAPLTTLASAILASVDFDEDHLYEFSYRNRFGALEQVYHWDMEEPLLASEVAVGDLALRVGQEMTFLFDFGDNWEFQLLLEAVDPERAIDKVQLLDSYGEAPLQYPNEDYDDENFEDFEDDDEDGFEDADSE